MRKQTLILVLSWCLTSPSFGAEPPSPPRSPKETIELFSKMDAEGGRLTPEGWYKGASFFLKPTPPPKKMIMLVMADVDQTVGTSTTKGNSAEVWTEYMALGKLDSSGHFTRTVGLVGGSSKYPLKGPMKFRDPYRLILSSEYWELGSDGTARTASGPPQWRVDPFHPEPRISIETAMRYLRTLRDSSSDPATKKNARRGIAALKRLQTAK